MAFFDFCGRLLCLLILLRYAVPSELTGEEAEVLAPPDPADVFGPDFDQGFYPGLYSGPYFDPTGTPSNVTAQAGDVARLGCRVIQAEGRSVSWIRLRDYHILAVDDVTYISNPRFVVLRPEQGREWNLNIKNVSASDAGDYECQVSGARKMANIVRLKVVVASVSLIGESGLSDVHAEAGSDVRLECRIRDVLKKPLRIRWFHNGAALVGEHFSSLTLASVTASEAGQYSCEAASASTGRRLASPGRLTLHVVNGETLARAMSDDSDKPESSAASASATAGSAQVSSLAPSSRYGNCLFSRLMMLLLPLELAIDRRLR